MNRLCRRKRWAAYAGSGIFLLMLLSMTAGCCSQSSLVYSEPKLTYGPDDSKADVKISHLAVVISSSAGASTESHQKSVRSMFEGTFSEKGYIIVPRNDVLNTLTEELVTQEGDLTEQALAQIGELKNPTGLVIVDINELKTTPVDRVEEQDGRKMPVKRYVTEVRIIANLYSLMDGTLLWTANGKDVSEGEDNLTDTNLMNEVAGRVASSISPRSWWWFLFH